MQCCCNCNIRGVWCRQEKHGQIALEALSDKFERREAEEICASAASMANTLGARAIFVYTRRGYMANWASRCRPDCPIFAFTGLSLTSIPSAQLQACRFNVRQVGTHITMSPACLQFSCIAFYLAMNAFKCRGDWLNWLISGILTPGCIAADKQDVRQRLNLRWGVIPFLMDFDPNPEANTYKTFNLLKTRTMISPGDLVIVVSDLKPDDGNIVRGIQLRRVPHGPAE